MTLRRRLRRRAAKLGYRLLGGFRRGPGPDTAPTSALQPVFVGGTGRSGTTITAALLGRHSAYRLFVAETKFISNPGGLCDLASGRTTYRSFEKRLLGQWWDRGPRSGLKTILDRAAVDEALPALRRGLRRDPYRAAASFAHRLLDPLAERDGRRGWIEMTPSSAVEADTMVRLFPRMQLIHMVRDGRDVAASVVRMPWGPSEPLPALDWWADRLERAFEACTRIPPDRVLVVRLEELIGGDREREYARILAFLGLDDEPPMRAFFDERMTASGLHAGRWRTEVPAELLPAFEERYAAIEARFRARGRPYRTIDPALDASAAR